MFKTKRTVFSAIIALIICAIMAVSVSLFSGCAIFNGSGNNDDNGDSENKDPATTEGVWEEKDGVRYSLVTDEDCPNGNVVDSKADAGITLELEKTYYLVADFTIKPKANNAGADTLFTSVKFSDDKALSVTEQELSSSKTESNVSSSGVRTFKISYGIPESVKKPKNVRMIFKLVPKAVAEVDLEITFKSSGTEVADLPIVEKTLAVGYTSGLEMVKSGGNYQVKSVGTATSKKIIIPEVYQNLQVTEIGDRAFDGNEKLTSITIPKSVKKVGYRAVQNCANLTEINYNAENVESWDGAFSGSGKDGGGIVLNVGKDVKKIPSAFMQSVSNLYKVNFDAECPVTKFEDSAFRGCTALSEITLPQGLVTIGVACFRECSSLKQITLPESVATIYESAFYDCSSLEKANIPENVTKLEYACFAGCNSLKSITIPQNIRSMANYAFSKCKGLTEIKYNAKNCESVGDYLFNEAGSDGLGIKVTLSKSVVRLPIKLFASAPKITEVEFENGCAVTAISNYAFDGCKSLAKITFPSGLTSIGECSFRNTGFVSLVLPENLQAIAYCSFNKCKSLEEVSLPDSLVTFGRSAFNGCTSLSEITVPENVTTLGAYALYNCKSLKKVNFNAKNCSDLESSNYTFNYAGEDVGGFNLIIGKNVQRIPNYFCNSTVNVRSVTFADDCALKSIGAYAFSGNSQISEIKLPQITSIGNYAFYNCTSLESIVLPSTITEIGYSTFRDCTMLTSAEVNYSGVISNSMFQSCNMLSKVTVSGGITSFGESAFNGCTSLTKLDFGGTFMQWGAITKNRYWKDNSGITGVKCSDGQVYNV